MPEENVLNQALEQEDGLFDDYTEDTPIEEAPSETQDVESTSVDDTKTDEVKVEPTTQKEAINEPFLNITYNKESLGLTREEAIELAQKGKNYDKLNERYNNLNSNIEKLARQNGMSIDEYINGLATTQQKFEVNKEFKELKKQYPNSDDAMLNELATARVKDRNAQNEIKFTQERNEKANAQRSEIQDQINKFQKRFPNLAPDKLDNDVYEMMKDGYTLLESYSIWKDKQADKMAQQDDSQSKISKINEENKKKSLGNINNVESVETDAFLSSFMNY